MHARFTALTPSVDVVGGGNISGNSLYPLPPVGTIRAVNDNVLTAIISPMYKFTWVSYNGIKGSKLTSFPIDMRNRNGSVLTLGVQRTMANANVNRGFCDNELIGPEPRIAFNNVQDSGNANNKTSGRIYNVGSAGGNFRNFEPDFDYLAVEYLTPTPDGIRRLTMTGGAPYVDNIENDSAETNIL